LGKRSCKQLSAFVTVQKKFLPKSYLHAERGSTPVYAHAESYGISYTMGWMILGPSSAKIPIFGTEQQLDHGGNYRQTDDNR